MTWNGKQIPLFPASVWLSRDGNIFRYSFGHADTLLHDKSQGCVKGGDALVAFHDLKIDFHAELAEELK